MDYVLGLKLSTFKMQCGGTLCLAVIYRFAFLYQIIYCSTSQFINSLHLLYLISPKVPPITLCAEPVVFFIKYQPDFLCLENLAVIYNEGCIMKILSRHSRLSLEKDAFLCANVPVWSLHLMPGVFLSWL